MSTPILNYDEVSDTLYVSFSPGEQATGIELNDHILLRVDKKERRAIGLTFFDYSLLAQRTEELLRRSGDREYYRSEDGAGCGLDPFWGWSLLGHFFSYELEHGVDVNRITADTVRLV